MSIKTNNVFVNNCLPSKQVKQRDKQNYSLKATEFASQSRNDDKGIGKDRIIAIIGTISAVIIASAVVPQVGESKEQVEALIEKINEQIKQLPQTSL
ncbi:9153_t:CDS:2, partial [Gigaspora rosea]